MIEFGSSLYVKPGTNPRDVTFIVQEYASNGELFDMLKYTGAFSENESRFYFK